MTQIELDDIVKAKLTKYKDSEGIKTYSDAVNMLLANIGLTKELLFIVQENQNLIKVNQSFIKLHDTKSFETVDNKKNTG